MRFTLWTFGKQQPKWVSEGFSEYTKRMPRDCEIHLIELDTRKRHKNVPLQQVIFEETQQWLSLVPKEDWKVVLDERGRSYHSIELSKQLEKWMFSGRNVSLLVGGPDGIGQEAKERADVIWSLSPLTFPHGLVRVMVVEQLYRARMILEGHPYHRE